MNKTRDILEYLGSSITSEIGGKDWIRWGCDQDQTEWDYCSDTEGLQTAER